MACPYSSTIYLISLLPELCFTGGLIVTLVGDDAVLPCDVGATIDPSMDILWRRTDLPRDQYVHVQRNGKEVPGRQKSSYKGRTALFQGEVEKGNVSLELSRVKPSDEGNYTCKLPAINKESTVQLIVEPHQVTVKKGEAVILPCQTNVPVDNGSPVVWSRADLTPPYAHVIRNSQELPVKKNPVYTDRTSVSVDRVKHGDVSLTISSVQLSDRGLYTCSISTDKECAVQLTVVSPEVHVYAEESNNPDNIILLCLGTGFHPKDFTLDITRDGRVVDEPDGLQSTAVQPNGDGTFRMKKHVEILRRDRATYSCVLHTSNMTKVQVWDKDQPASPSLPPYVYAVMFSGVSILLPILGLCLCAWKKGQRCVRTVQSKGTNQGTAVCQTTNQSRAPDNVYEMLQHDRWTNQNSAAHNSTNKNRATDDDVRLSLTHLSVSHQSR